MTLSFPPILIAGIAAVLIGFLWYHPRVFGGAWMRMSNITPEMANADRRSMWLRALVAMLGSMLAAYFMGYFGLVLGVADWVGALQLALWCWIGFVAPTMLGVVLWERKPLALYLINSLYWLVVFALTALVLLYA
jgi:hypothetical protein